MLNQDLKKDYFQGFLTNSGIKEAVGDFSLDQEDYEYINIDKRKLFITNLTICIEDNAKLKFDKYGAETKLKKGIKLYYTSSGKKTYIFGEEQSVRCNRDWLQYSCDLEQISFNNNHSFLKIKFNFHKENNQYIILPKGEKICMELNDDFSGLENQTFHLTGFLMKI